MNLLFLDLEFNKSKTINEIIRISAIKTDMFLNEISSIDYFVTLNHKSRLKKRISELTGITENNIRNHGIPFKRIVEGILKPMVADVDYIICWSENDELVFKQNCISKKVDYKFLDNIEFIDAQFSYMKLNGLSGRPSLVKVSDELNFYTHHNSLHDVYRLIYICKKVGIHNIILYKDTPINRFNRFLKKRKLDTMGYECICGCDTIKPYIDLNTVVNQKTILKRIIFKCRSCSSIYLAEYKIKDVVKSSKIKQIDFENYQRIINHFVKHKSN